MLLLVVLVVALENNEYVAAVVADVVDTDDVGTVVAVADDIAGDGDVVVAAQLQLVTMYWCLDY